MDDTSKSVQSDYFSVENLKFRNFCIASNRLKTLVAHHLYQHSWVSVRSEIFVQYWHILSESFNAKHREQRAETNASLHMQSKPEEESSGAPLPAPVPWSRLQCNKLSRVTAR